MIFAVPLAWLQLTREKMRLLVALAGISFAVILMMLQLGFRPPVYFAHCHEAFRTATAVPNPLNSGR
jgi:putative ABC transport system permease protein